MAQSSLAIVEGPDTPPGGGLSIIDGPPSHDTSPTPTTKKKSWRQQTNEQNEAALREGGGAVLRGALSTVQGLAAPIRKAFGMKPAVPLREETTAVGKTARGLEQVGEFAVPEAVGSKIAEAAKAGRFVKAGVKAGISAAGNYMVASGQGDTRPGVAAAVGAAGPAVELTAPAAYRLLRTGAKAGLSKVLGASVVAPDVLNAAIRKVVPTALDEGLKPTWAAWLRQRQGAKAVAGKAIETALDGPLGSSHVPLAPVHQALDDLANRAAKHVVRAADVLKGQFSDEVIRTQGESAITYNKKLLDQINKIKKLLYEYGETIPARQIVDLKRSWDDFVYQAGKEIQVPTLSSYEKRVKETAANAIRSVLDNDAPTLAKLNRAYELNAKLHALVLGAARGEAVGAVAGRAAQQASSTLGRNVRMGVGATVGGGLGYERTHSISGAILGGVAGGVTERLLETALASPAFRLWPAASKQALATAIADGKADTVRKLITPLLAKTGAGSAEAK